MAKVLIVDDSPTEVHIFSSALSEAGHDVLVATDGEEGVQKASEQQPDLILMDVVMPGLNGFQATRKIHRNASTKHIPIIIVTTKDQDTDREWGMRQGARDYLVKPVDMKELLQKVTLLAAS
ncbi:MAG: response regulator [Gammaproteobacteria bacterium]|nr:MAG: response regulator [Gammaproteobacteria bacterium]RTZ75299.1 MAG: response regulator [Gammaproteobacteria bacterium]